jgi:hypothetical protein
VGKNSKDVPNLSGHVAGDLPFNAISCPSLVLLLDRFAFRQQRFCGLQDECARLNARWVLEAVIHGMLQHHGDWCLHLDMVAEWENIFPRPARYDAPVMLTITKAGQVDLSLWRAMGVKFGPRSFAARSWVALSADGTQPLDCLNFIKALGDPSSTILSCLFAQFLFHFAIEFEKMLTKLANGGGSCVGVGMNKVEVADLISDRCSLDNYLYRYVQTAKSRTRGQQFWTACSDKSAVGGFSLQATLFAFSDNTGICAPPAVGTEHIY